MKLTAEELEKVRERRRICLSPDQIGECSLSSGCADRIDLLELVAALEAELEKSRDEMQIWRNRCLIPTEGVHYDLEKARAEAARYKTIVERLVAWECDTSVNNKHATNCRSCVARKALHPEGEK